MGVHSSRSSFHVDPQPDSLWACAVNLTVLMGKWFLCGKPWSRNCELYRAVECTPVTCCVFCDMKEPSAARSPDLCSLLRCCKYEITWYLLRSEQLLPLLTVKEGKFNGPDTTDHHTNNHRMKCDGTLQTGLVSLEIQEVEEEDAGLYFCIGRFADKMHVNRGIQLTVDGKTIRRFCCQLELSSETF